MDERFRKEWKRQMFHIAFGLALVILIRFNILSLKGLAILFFAGFILSLLSRKYDIPGIRWFLKHFSRVRQKGALPGRGILFYVLGAFFSLLFFSEDIALASIMILALGDSVATLFGIQDKARIKHPFSSHKYLEAGLLGGIAGFFGAMLFINPLYAFIASMIAMLIEGIDIRLGFTQVDDNLIIPVAAGVILTLLKMIFG